MQKQEMIDQLSQRSQSLRQELIQLQESFNIKKEQLIKVEGALEALSLLEPENFGEEQPKKIENKVEDKNPIETPIKLNGVGNNSRVENTYTL